ncbi:BMP family protein [Paenibacillus soyae]|uniref:BMP family protein n=1 Tax=Paenibacillus soyae TaxID=2969249 RepID=A0A9X2MPN8_9BACL|nr:BMP family protein [Paenibacillus soyae]MCR2804145.1 BMP family protein [Paenibacillus soyae]
MRKVQVVKGLAVLCMGMALSMAAACANAGGADSGGDAAEPLKVALLTPGPINDNGWNATAYAGLTLIQEELGAETAYSEKVGNSDAAEFIRGYAEDGYDVIIGHGFEYGDVMKEIAPDFEDTWFLVNSSTLSQEPNLASLSLNNSEQGYLMGSIAALMSQTGKVAAIGGSEIPPITKSVQGFELGAKETVPSIEVLTTMLGGDSDVAKAKETAISFIEEGADVVMTNANQAGLGGIEAAKQKGVLAIGSNQDQNPNAPDTVVTSVIQDYPQAMKVVVERISKGEMKAESQLLGVKEGAIYLAPFHGFEDKIPQETKDKIEAIVASLMDGVKVISNE